LAFVALVCVTQVISKSHMLRKQEIVAPNKGNWLSYFKRDPCK